MNMPELESADAKDITMSWMPLKGYGMKYELFGDADDDEKFESIILTDKISYKVFIMTI